MEPNAEPAFAWYRLEGRESALLLVVALLVVGLSSLVALTSPAPTPVAITSSTPPPALVYVNRAGVAELASLPGIGVRKAERIVEARKTAPITTMDEMAKAAGGIPQTSRDRMAPFVRFVE